MNKIEISSTKIQAKSMPFDVFSLAVVVSHNSCQDNTRMDCI